MAVTITAAELAEATSMPAADAARLLPVATEKVERYAPDAPEALQNEAVVRYCGYLHGSDYGGVKSETTGPLSIEYQTNHAAAWRNSGAGALLSGHRVRRAGAIG
ncbi:MAG: hypothetical protein OXC00_16060 [Acidimicrobiaceae bacterium]|nr:hypothetical protein [Acidimicrobiaceae bacterium]